MSNIASILKAEIVRVSRKEVRSEILAVKKANAQHRASIAALRREVETLRKELRRSMKTRRSQQPDETAGARADEGDVSARRFSASRLAAHRGKLGLSAAAYGKLVGLSGQTVYNWEQGKSRPSAQQIQQLAALKEMKPAAVFERLGIAGSERG
ncbi:DNA-binding transcriptional regulator [Variovorax sp. dw_308]|uniref:helix-turn-helix domain-containing protein n=1 Tax=Variovorax sp. dw_308 TaxID=2721546 RepID=UPI001C44E630|nr:helix-turn-helix transcriptional regulator [Variovorax sp. dw_308]